MLGVTIWWSLPRGEFDWRVFAIRRLKFITIKTFYANWKRSREVKNANFV